MCEKSTAVDALRDIPFRVASLENALPRGSHERSLARCVYDSVRHDIDYAIKKIEAGKQEQSGKP